MSNVSLLIPYTVLAYCLPTYPLAACCLALPIPWLPVASPYTYPLAACCLPYTYPLAACCLPIPWSALSVYRNKWMVMVKLGITNLSVRTLKNKSPLHGALKPAGGLNL